MPRLRGSPRPGATSTRAEILTPTRTSPEGLNLAVSRGRREPCARDHHQPTETRASVLPRQWVGLPRHATSPRYPAPEVRRAGVSSRAALWRTVRCRGPGCGTVFYLCGSCYWGQAYCGIAAARPRNAVNGCARPPSTSVAWKAGSITGTANGLTARAVTFGDVTDTPAPRSPRLATITPPVGHAASQPVCLVCGRVWARRGARRGPPARQGGAQRRKALDDGHS